MPPRHRSLIPWLAGLLALWGAGCSPSPEGSRGSASGGAPPDAGRGAAVGVSLLTQDHPFYQEMEKAMRAKARELGLTLKIQAAEMDLDRQTQQVENFLNQGVQALVVCPVDSDSIGGAISKANAAGVPVFTADIRANQGKVVSHIASDNVEGGRAAGRALLKALAAGTHRAPFQVAIIDHPVVSSVQDRTRGFLEEIGKTPQVRVVARLDGGGKRDTALEKAETALRKHPELSAFFAINDDSALACLAALKAAGRGDVVVIGYDASEEARREILSGGPLKAEVIQHPEKIGAVTIETIAKHLKGEMVPSVIPIEVGILDREKLQASGATP